MKQFLLTAVIFLLGSVAFGQGSSFGTADTTSLNNAKNGIVTAASPDKYVKVFLPVDGTIRIARSFTNSGSGLAGMRTYMYSRNQIQLATKDVYINPGATVVDTFNIYGRAKDSFYVRLSNLSSINSISYTINILEIDTSALNESGPNETVAQAQLITMSDTVKGHIAYYYDNGIIDTNDYYKAVLPADGTLRLFLSGSNFSGAASAWAPMIYIYDKSGNLLNIANTAGVQISNGFRIRNEYYLAYQSTNRDTMMVFGRAADTVYFKVSNYNSGTTAYPSAYTLRWDLIHQSPLNEAGPNNTLATAQLITPSDTVKGHVAYFSNAGVIDTNDYYKAVLPADGTLRLFVTGTNYNGYQGTSWAPIVYVYDKGGNSLTIVNSAGTQIANGFRLHNEYYLPFLTSNKDTMHVYSRAADTVYFRVTNYNSGATAYPSAYTLRWDLIHQSSLNEAGPNNTFATAQLISPADTVKGHTAYYGNNTTIDTNDYYKAVLPADGTLRLFVTGTNYNGYSSVSWAPIFYVYDRSGNPLTIVNNAGTQINNGFRIRNEYYLPFLNTIGDTMHVYGRAADTVYFRVTNYNSGATAYPAAYTLRWDLIHQSPLNETGPNNTFATAQLITPGDTVKGHTAYYGNNATIDTNDYYKVILSASSTMRLFVSGTNYNGYANVSWAPMFFVYDRSGNPLTIANNAGTQISNGFRVRNEYYLPFLNTIRDTMNVYGRAADTIYVRVSNYNSGATAYPAAYTLRYDMTDVSPNNEAAQNGTFATAQSITALDTIRGHIAYYGNNTAIDTNDYFRIIKPANGSIKLFIKAINTNGYTGSQWAPIIHAYDKNRNPINVTTATGVSSGAGLRLRNEYYQNFRTTIADTMMINCIAGDTVYLRITNYNSGATAYPASYNFRYEYIGVAKAAFEYTRTGNEFGFINTSTGANSYQWSMGNGNNYTSMYPPIINYVPGFYNVRLIAQSTVCNYRDTIIKSFTVAGVESYTPKFAGAGGDARIQVYGGGLDSNTKVTLRQGTTLINPREKYTNTKLNHFTAIMDLHFAAPGLYDVIIEVPGQSPITYTNGFRIDGFVYPTAWSQVVGPSRWLANVDNRFTLTVGNKGNVTASGVVVAMVWPKTVTVKWLNKDEPVRLTGIDTLVTPSKTYAVPRSKFKFLDSLNTTAPIDSFEGKPYDGYIRYLLVRHVPSGATVDIPFTARATMPAAQKFITFTHRPNIFGSCATENYEDLSADLASELIDAADMFADYTKVPAFQAFTKTAKIGQRHMQSAASYAGREFWAWWDGYEIDHNASQADWIRETEANNEYALQVATEEIGGLLLNSGINRAGSLNDRIKIYNDILANNPALSPASQQRAADIINASGKALGGINYDRVKLLKEMLDDVKKIQTLNDKIQKLERLVIDCPELQQQLDELKKLLGQELDHNGKNELNTNSVNSMDPNDIYGPSGVGAPRYINNVQRQPFLITFENVDSATADAQVVRVVDTINKARFNINTVVLNDVVVGRQTIQVPKGRNQFMVQHRLDSIPGILLRVTANTDTIAGIIIWTFTAIDSATNNRPLLRGFLPPNVDKIQGTGSVAYSIEPLPSLTDGTTLSSRALIYFDGNVSIATSTWTNTIDILPPSSNVLSATLTSDTVIHLKMNGTDATSGIRKYNIYYQTNSGAWRLLGATFTDSMTLVGQHDSTYRFYSRAIDQVENIEVKNPVSEAIITIPSGIATINRQYGYLSVFPNPADEQATISFEMIQTQDVNIGVYSITGQKVSDVFNGAAKGRMKITTDLSRLPAGIYSIQVSGAKGAKLLQKLVVTH